MRRLLLILLLFQQTVLAQQSVVYDTSQTETRHFSSAELDTYKKDRHFQYKKYVAPQTWLDRLIDWISRKIDALFSTKTAGATMNWVVIFLSIIIIVFFIWKLTGMNNTALFGKKNKGEKLLYSAGNEDIHTISFDESIRQAVADKNFRLAVRLLYLQSLKQLADKSLIRWQIDKTNIAYVQELQGTAWQQSFGELTFRFENNWYGDIPIDEHEFEIVREQFNKFNKQLS